MGPTVTDAGGSGSGFVQSMSENRVGMFLGPAVGQHLFQTRVIRIKPKR